MKKTSLRHVIDLTDKAIHKHKEGGIARIPAKDRVYQFKITLKEIDPPIWRRIQTKDCTLDKLHERIQTAMGWTNSHLHQFVIDSVIHGDPQLLYEGWEDETPPVDSLETRISQVVPKDGKPFRFDYEYDFGDCWEHEVLFEGCLRAEKGVRYPVCIEGERACPPEDVGGVCGYQEYLKTLSNPDHEEWDQMSDWRGPCRPEHFDVQAATKAMRRGLPNWREME
ncbi:MAG: plasmid pRiA4b ORF-3 family protein [Thermoguttaceae bacterium]|nr:plasmid pRiA4b ORF-3 family protein [Thermoguttaceae bacterium]